MGLADKQGRTRLFERVWASMDGDAFIPSRHFDGEKYGYIFKSDSQGVGYYLDNGLSATSSASNSHNKKRPKPTPSPEADTGDIPVPRWQANPKKVKYADYSNSEANIHAVTTQSTFGASASGSGIAPATVNGMKMTQKDEELLAAAEERAKKENTFEEIITLDEAILRKLLHSLDKVAKQNAQLRLKHATDPVKYIDSEIELAVSIRNLTSLTTYPHLFTILVQSSSMETLMNLMSHENDSIASGIVSLFAEMVDTDGLVDHDESDGKGEDDESAAVLAFVDELLKRDILSIIVANLIRLDDASQSIDNGELRASEGEKDDTVKSTSYCLTLMENITDARPSAMHSLAVHRELITYLFESVDKGSAERGSKAGKESGGGVGGLSLETNVLHASEMLSMLLQYTNEDNDTTDTASRKGKSDNPRQVALSLSMHAKKGEDHVKDCVELLLEVLSRYRKKAPTDPGEFEFITNVALSLCCLIQWHGDDATTDGKGMKLFVQHEGIELMIMCLKSHSCEEVSGACLRVLSYAIDSRYPANCIKFVEKAGLKYLFPCYMGRGFKQSHNLKSNTEYTETLEFTLSILYNLILTLHDSTELDAGLRLANKFNENNHEKTARLLSIIQHYFQRYRAIEEVISLNVSAMARSTGREESEIRLEDEENIYMSRLNGGLFVLQRLCTIASYVVATSNQDGEGGKSARQAVLQGLQSMDMEVSFVTGVIREQLVYLMDTEGGSASLNNERTAMLEWCKVLESS